MTGLVLGPNPGRDTRIPAVVHALKRWTRDALAIGTDTVVSVNELACTQPGCAPRETVILVLGAEELTRRLSIHKAMVDVTEIDVTSGWRSAVTEAATSSRSSHP